MKRFTDAGREAIKQDNYYSALSLALMIPDICGSLEDPGPGKSKARYTKWYTQWALSKFSATLPGQAPTVYVTADDCFQLRCSLIHSGSAEIEQNKGSALDHFVFCDKHFGAHLVRMSGNTVNGVLQPAVLQLKADEFSDAMFDAADEWDLAMVGNFKVQSEKRKLLVIHSGSLSLQSGVIRIR